MRVCYERIAVDTVPASECICGIVVGMLALYFVMLLVGSDFGLDNVRAGAPFGGVIGFLLGLRFRWL
jgi:hypothetical protein